jgi:hypothetical protein
MSPPCHGGILGRVANLPDPAELFTVDHADLWPVGVTKVEVDDGHPYFYGSFSAVDAATAERAFPGRRVVLEPWDEEGRGNLILHASTCTPASCPLWRR